MSAISHEKQMRPTTEQTISKPRLIALEKQDGTFTVEVSIAFVLITLFYVSKFGCGRESLDSGWNYFPNIRLQKVRCLACSLV